MPTPIHAAARRLSGHLVATPVIGDLRLPGFQVSAGLRVKAECLQIAGSAWYRGYMHFLLQSFGRYKGLVLHGTPRQLVAQALAGVQHRLPMLAVAAGLVEPFRSLVVSTGCAVVDASEPAAAADAARERGFHLVPGVEDRAVRAGVATLGLELAIELPAEVGRVVLTETSHLEPVVAGFYAAERDCEVVIATGGAVHGEFRAAVAEGLRVVPDDASLAALSEVAADERPTCVVLS